MKYHFNIIANEEYFFEILNSRPIHKTIEFPFENGNRQHLA